MAIQIPFPIPPHGVAMNSKMRINLDFLVNQFNEFNTGSATWDTVAIGTANNLTGTLTFYNSSNAFYLTFQPGATAVDTTYTFPAALPISSSGHLLLSTGSGVMSWDANEWLVTADTPGVLITGIAGAGTIININNTLGAAAFIRQDDGVTNPKFVTLLGTSNQVVVTHNSTNTTLSLPQSIGTSNDVTFAKVTLENGSLTDEAVVIGSGGGVVGIYNTGSSAIGFSVGTSLAASIDGGGNITAIGGLIGQSLQLEETGAGTDKITIQAPASIAAAYSLTLPVDDGASGEVLSTNGSGVLSWISPGSGANTALSNLASVAINTTLVSDTNNTDDLGTSSIRWGSLYIANALSQVGSISGGEVLHTIQNTSNTASSFAGLYLIVGGSSAADPYIGFSTGTDWTIGCDNSDSDSFVLANSTALGTTNIVKVTTGGQVQLGLTSSDGTAASPIYRFGSRNSGFYTDGASNINISCNGVLAGNFAVANSYMVGNFNSNTSAGSSLGGATEYWNDVSYKTLTDRGCLPWCDDGVEMTDGTRKSDVDAICSIKKHPTQKTVHGLPKLDYSTFPKHAYKTVESELPNVRRDKEGRAWVYSERQGKEIEAQDGVEMTMMFGVMIGAIKELKAEIEALKAAR